MDYKEKEIKVDLTLNFSLKVDYETLASCKSLKISNLFEEINAKEAKDLLKQLKSIKNMSMLEKLELEACTVDQKLLIQILNFIPKLNALRFVLTKIIVTSECLESIATSSLNELAIISCGSSYTNIFLTIKNVTGLVKLVLRNCSKFEENDFLKKQTTLKSLSIDSGNWFILESFFENTTQLETLKFSSVYEEEDHVTTCFRNFSAFIIHQNSLKHVSLSCLFDDEHKDAYPQAHFLKCVQNIIELPSLEEFHINVQDQIGIVDFFSKSTILNKNVKKLKLDIKAYQFSAKFIKNVVKMFPKIVKFVLLFEITSKWDKKEFSSDIFTTINALQNLKTLKFKYVYSNFLKSLVIPSLDCLKIHKFTMNSRDIQKYWFPFLKRHLAIKTIEVNFEEPNIFNNKMICEFLEVTTTFKNLESIIIKDWLRIKIQNCKPWLKKVKNLMEKSNYNVKLDNVKGFLVYKFTKKTVEVVSDYSKNCEKVDNKISPEEIDNIELRKKEQEKVVELRVRIEVLIICKYCSFN